MNNSRLLLFVAILFSSAIFAQEEDTRLMRFPTIHGDLVVFSYAGDLYSVANAGGIARRLTNDDGLELFPRISPNGKTIAFTGQYDGNTEVYTIPADGGIPVRLTYTATLSRDDVSDRMGPNNIVMTWKDDESIVYRSRKQTFNSFQGQLFEVTVNGGLSTELPLPTGGFCSFSPDKKKLAYNQVFREFRTWKYYEGGMADDVWIYDFKTKETINVTNNKAQDIFPMWHGEIIYFLSDRDRIMNLFSYNTKTEETKKLTNYSKFDIKFPSLGNDAIIYENGGYLYAFDLNSQLPSKIEIQILNDFTASRPQWKDGSKTITGGFPSPDGKRVVFGSRGDVFSVPVNSGITKNLTNSNGAHDRNQDWSPDGKWIAFISDKSGETEIYIMKPDGSEEPVQLTKNADTYKFGFEWSPDSKKIAWTDQKKRLQFVDIDTRDVTLVEATDEGEFRTFVWTPDSKWLAYVKPSIDQVSRIYAYNLETKDSQAMTDEWFDSRDPSFSPDGKYMYFSSARSFNPIYSWTEWNHAFQDMMKVYMVTLTKDTESPFEPENDVVEIEDEEAKDKKEDKPDKKDEKTDKEDELSVNIDFDGIAGRVIEISSEAASYWGITAVEDGVYYSRFKSGDEGSAFIYFDLKKKKENELGNNIGYVLSGNGKKMLISENGKWAVIDPPKGKVKPDEFIDVSNIKLWVDPRVEWQQIYDESWRQMRDFFYDPNMHGVDWDDIYKKYNALIPYVNNRYDLSYVIGEMIGELNVGHAYVSGGDRIQADRIKTGLLGAQLSRDKSGYYRIDKILPGQNWNKAVRSPLTEVGVDVSEGDYIVAVNGKSTKDMVDIYRALVGKANVIVELGVNASASEEDARQVLVKPIDDESELYYYAWVHENIRKVNEASNGQIGYIHIPDMGPGGLNEFVKYFYPQMRKKALIIDDRGNGGGNVSPMIIERLRRELSLMGMGRNNVGEPTPGAMMLGPMVCLINGYSASDGDLFPYQFKKHDLGKLIGTRTWGGVVGIRGSLPFIDGGDLRKPEFAHYNAEGTDWIIEGHGVEPDIEVRNDPALEYEGIDEQLNKAIEVLLEDIRNNPKDYPKVPPFPDKSK
ncbi:MAG: PDZ domain-containing protein [Bacteroidales bacterium]|nr:PDZ domain-containing protein [Bacteroidales bacterium]